MLVSVREMRVWGGKIEYGCYMRPSYVPLSRLGNSRSGVGFEYEES